MRRLEEAQALEEKLSIGEQRRLQKAVAIKVYDLDKELLDQRARFKELYQEIKIKFNVTSYTEIGRPHLQEAIRYIEGWQPRKEF